VIGRDHLDCGSVASPYRETEAMIDGSDAIADWPLLNALVNASSGASWVSIHHGGGVGIGRSIHAGQVTVADGTALAAEKLARVLTNDPGLGVLRHVDAGYEEASEVAEERGVRGRMREGRAGRAGRFRPGPGVRRPVAAVLSERGRCRWMRSGRAPGTGRRHPVAATSPWWGCRAGAPRSRRRTPARPRMPCAP